MGVLQNATRPASLAVVLVVVLGVVLVVVLAVLIVLVVLLVVLVLVLVLVVHLEIPPFFYLRQCRVNSMPGFSGFILAFEDHSDQQACENGHSDATGCGF